MNAVSFHVNGALNHFSCREMYQLSVYALRNGIWLFHGKLCIFNFVCSLGLVVEVAIPHVCVPKQLLLLPPFA